jgi:hypothetical protein
VRSPALRIPSQDEREGERKQRTHSMGGPDENGRNLIMIGLN